MWPRRCSSRPMQRQSTHYSVCYAPAFRAAWIGASWKSLSYELTDHLEPSHLSSSPLPRLSSRPQPRLFSPHLTALRGRPGRRLTYLLTYSLVCLLFLTLAYLLTHLLRPSPREVATSSQAWFTPSTCYTTRRRTDLGRLKLPSHRAAARARPLPDPQPSLNPASTQPSSPAVSCTGLDRPTDRPSGRLNE